MKDQLRDPASEFSLMPFWFWNDVLEEQEILRQIADFQAHGVHGFVIHPRVGLPRDCGWMSEKLLGFMSVAIDEAARRGMKVILYDEGMYPSGSSSGQVVARWPELACRCLALHNAAQPLPANANVIQEIQHQGNRTYVIDRPVNSCIRGLHYIGEGPAEDEPPAGDILNPATAAAVIELVHDRFFSRFRDHFGSTILGIFTDEPSPLGRCREKEVVAGTTGIVEEVSRLLGYDFRPHLHHLWSTDQDAKSWRDAWQKGIRLRLNETWYAPLSRWCEEHGVALCGHPDKGDEIGVQRFFHYPGQDLVWRWVEPGKATGLRCDEATQGKCTSSAMVHDGRRRNSNEFGGAYGRETTFEEIRALANWCLVRGVNLLIPHAFYYSVRGPRRDERPPQIGPHTPQWDTGEFTRFADECRRLCWVNTDCRHLCHVAILTHDDRCPWPAAAALLSRQRDFNYLEPQVLLSKASVDENGIAVAGMHYTVLVIDGGVELAPELHQKLAPLVRAGRALRWTGSETEADGEVPSFSEPADLAKAIDGFGSPPLRVESSSEAIRVRVVEKEGAVYGMIFNEGAAPSTAEIYLVSDTTASWMDTTTGNARSEAVESSITLDPFELRLLRLQSSASTP